MKTIPIALVVLLTAVVAVAALSVSRHDERGSSGKNTGSVEAGATKVEPIPAPTGKAIITISGVLGGNVGTDTTKVDFQTIDRLARKQVTIYEPFLKRDVTFTAIPAADFLQAAGFPPSAAHVQMRALDDYEVNLVAAGVRSAGMLATRMNGKPMTIAQGGPVRLIFTGKGHLAVDSDNWIWSIKTIRAGR
jgi:hypothetical protein